jgi:hypothetical protein
MNLAEPSGLNSRTMPHRQPQPPAPAHRPCRNCGLPEGMKLQNSGVFTVHYTCDGCGTSLTLPPPKLVVPPSTFEQ